LGASWIGGDGDGHHVREGSQRGWKMKTCGSEKAPGRATSRACRLQLAPECRVHALFALVNGDAGPAHDR
jgi:hypothetical protein